MVVCPRRLPNVKFSSVYRDLNEARFVEALSPNNDNRATVTESTGCLLMMMTTTKLYARTGAAAIAAVLALSSTALSAQQAPASDQPAPTVTPPPTTSDSAPVTSTDTPAPDASTADTTVPAAQPKRAVIRIRSTAPVAPTRIVRHTTTRSAQVAATHVPTTTRIAAAAPPASASSANPIPQASVAPAAARQTAATTAGRNDEALEIGAGILALIVLGGAAWALSRRRDEEAVDEAYESQYQQSAEAEPPPAAAAYEEQPAIVGPAAFAWANRAAPGDESDRRPGESWVERAYRGPSPANPSASLRNRLKRAAFFDQRERDVAAGRAQPLDTDAGLPEAMADERERELA